LKEEEAQREKAYQKILADITHEQFLIRQAIRERQERERLEEIRKKEEAERKKAEEQRMILEALEKKKRDEEAQRKREEDEKKRKEEEARKIREEAERKKVEEERKIKEEAERKRIEDEKKEQERKLLEEEASKKRQEEAAAKKREEEIAQKKAEEQSIVTSEASTPTPPTPISPTLTSRASPPPSAEATQAEKERKKVFFALTLHERGKGMKKAEINSFSLLPQESKKYISPSALEEYRVVTQNFNGVLQTVQALEANPTFNDTKRRIIMEINLKLGQLCPDNSVVRARVQQIEFLPSSIWLTFFLFLFPLHLFTDSRPGSSVPRSSGTW
jgi:hypothetical protein